MKRRSLMLLIPLAALLLGGCAPYTTGETEVGVRTVKWTLFGEKGVEDKIYAPGSTYFFMPVINDFHTFDTKLQNMEMTIQRGKGDRAERDDLLFKTIDGNDIGLDVIIAFRLDPSMAPFVIQFVAENDTILRDKIVRAVARSKPRDIFGELTTEEFYNATAREKKAEEAKQVLQEILGPLGITVEKVLTKDYRFNPEYQKAIEAKKVADQMVEKNKSARHAAKEEYLKKLEDTQGDVNEMQARVDGEYQKAVLAADAYWTKQSKLAEAIEAEGVATAKGIEERNKALTGSGGETLVKLRIAEALKGKKIILLPMSEGGMNLKTTNVNSLLEVMGLKSIAGQKVP